MRTKLVIRNIFSPTEDPGIDCGKETQTKQSFKDECDVNIILKKFSLGQTIDHINKNVAVFSDFSSAKDYQESLNKVIAAQDAFNSLDAKIRARFSNDPLELLKFINDKNNLEEAQKLGLATSKPITPVKEDLKPITPVKEDLKPITPVK